METPANLSRNLLRRWCRALTMPSEGPASEAGAASWAPAPRPGSTRA